MNDNAWNLLNWLAGGKARFQKGRFIRPDGDTFMSSRAAAAELIGQRPALAEYVSEDELDLTEEGEKHIARAKRVNAVRFGQLQD